MKYLFQKISLFAIFFVILGLPAFAEQGNGKGQEVFYDEAGEFDPEAFEQSLILENAVAASEESAQNEEKKSPWAIFFLGFIGGLFALVTPCVFPMIPLTVSFFTKSSQNKKKGIFQAVLYGFFIFMIYVLLSAPFHLLDLAPDILNEISTNVWLNVAFFAVFVFFAGSFFGYYEIQLPSGLANKVSSAESAGGVLGVFFMALTLAIVSFSCTGPIIGSLLAGTLTQGPWPLTAGMAGFGVALGLPFALFALFPSWLNNLPKSGGWLNSVKVVLGFLELALAVKFLSNADLVAHWGILPREIFFLIWVIIGLLTTLYLFGVIKFPHDSPVKFKDLGKVRIGFGVLFLASTIYLSFGLMGRNLALLSGFPPPMYYSIFEDEDDDPLGDITEEQLKEWGMSENCPHDLPCFKDFHDGLAFAKHINKPILIDFTGFACVNCRKMEENVWPQEQILDILAGDVVLISLYVDDKEELPEEQQITVEHNGYSKELEKVGQKWSFFQTVNFKSNTQPLYVILSPDLEVLAEPVGYTPDAVEYKAWIEAGVKKFEEMNTTAPTASN